MPDLQLTFGTDLTIDATGDFVLSDGTQEGEERVYRRLLTNPGEYIWQIDYGAGLARFLGQPAVKSRIAAVSRAQMFREPAVSQAPPPTITVSVKRDGTVIEDIKYVDAVTSQQVVVKLTSAGPASTNSDVAFTPPPPPSDPNADAGFIIGVSAIGDAV